MTESIGKEVTAAKVRSVRRMQLRQLKRERSTPMLTLKEAVAKYGRAKAELLWAVVYAPKNISQQEKVLDAAVRNVALAVWYATVAPPSNSLSMAAVAENIDRLFPKEDLPHG